VIRRALAVAAFAAFGSAQAVELPQSSPYDNRIQHVNYNPADVVVVNALPGIGTRIVFAPDETVQDIATGFSQGWELSDSKNILYVKAKSVVVGQGQPPMSPEAGTWNTNLMVTTNKRMYDLELRLLADSTSGKVPASQRVSYRVQYLYPQDDAATAKAKQDAELAQTRLAAKPAPRNWNYSMQVGNASEHIAPAAAYDDGRFTYLKFPNNRDFPTVFIAAADKTESIVNSHIDPATPDTLVVQRVTRDLVLRLGNAVVAVYNDSFDPDGVPPDGGTTVPGVKRIIKAGEPH
jgi:P-type conjugative transfer protein VirB9